MAGPSQCLWQRPPLPHTHYYAPPQLSSIVESLYSGISAKVMTNDWSTSAIPLQVGVFQGDPFSVVIFNTVINTLLDALKVRPDLGYKLHSTSYCINTLQYADDTCLVQQPVRNFSILLTNG